MPRTSSISRTVMPPHWKARSHQPWKKLYRLAEESISSLRFVLYPMAASKISHTCPSALLASDGATRWPSSSTRRVLSFHRWSGVPVSLASSTIGLYPVLALSACKCETSGSIRVPVYPVCSAVGARLSLEVVQLLYNLHIDL